MARAANITKGFRWYIPRYTSNSEIKPLVPGIAALARVNTRKIKVNNGIKIAIPR